MKLILLSFLLLCSAEAIRTCGQDDDTVLRTHLGEGTIRETIGMQSSTPRWLLPKRERHPPILFFLVLLSLFFLLPQLLLLVRQHREADNSLERHAAAPEKKRLLPTPILVVGLPKTGTSTIHSFFARSGYRSSHYKCMDDLFCGLCIKAAVQQGKPPLKSCGDYEVWAQMDIENLGLCHFPQIHNLEELHQESPNATFILSHRNMTRWARSVTNWVGAARSMASRLWKCNNGPKTKKADDLIQWHLEHIQRIRDFVKSHPSHALVEINIEDPTAGNIMARHFGAPATNWGHENDSLNKTASRMSIRVDSVNHSNSRQP